MSFEGLWVSPDGERVPVIEHLLAIQQDPHVFGLTSRDVRGVNIKGLRDIAMDLFEEGWIRYRWFGGDSHMFELQKLDKERIDDILRDVKAMLDERVVIETIKPKREYVGTVIEFFDRSMLGSFEKNPKRTWRLSR